MLSSTWEAENRKHGLGEIDPEYVYKDHRIWGRKDIKEKLEKFHDQQVVKEFTAAVEEKRGGGGSGGKKNNRVILVRWRTFDVENTLDGNGEDQGTRIC